MGLQSELILAIQIADGVYERHGHELVITSINDGTHGRNSLHSFGYAFDARVKHLPNFDTAQAVYMDIKVSLGANYDVVFEHDARSTTIADTDHIHVEYDPR